MYGNYSGLYTAEAHTPVGMYKYRWAVSDVTCDVSSYANCDWGGNSDYIINSASYGFPDVHGYTFGCGGATTCANQAAGKIVIHNPDCHGCEHAAWKGYYSFGIQRSAWSCP